MGTPVKFVRAPRGDATKAPPPVGAQGQLGTSAQAAREDHTHEGVHKVLAGEGVSVSPSSGLGDVTVSVRHWLAPVQSVADLPASGNEPGDARVVLADAAIYVWTGTSWRLVSAAGGGGGGPGFDDWGALNRLHLGLEQVEAAGRPALTALSERYDALVDGSGIDWSRSANVELRDGRLVAKPSEWVGFGDDWARVRRPASSSGSRSVVQSLAPGAFEFGLAAAWTPVGFDAGVAGPVVAGDYRVPHLATEASPLASRVADGTFDAGITGVVATLPPAVQPYSARTTALPERTAAQNVVVALSPGGFDHGILPGAVLDPWGRTGGMECGITGVVAARREVVQFATGPVAQVQAADGTFEAGLTAVISRSMRRGGNPVVVSEPIVLPAAPSRAYLVARSERVQFDVSRDDGVTWTPITSDAVVDITGQPAGTRLRVRAVLEDERRSYVEALAYGASK